MSEALLVSLKQGFADENVHDMRSNQYQCGIVAIGVLSEKQY